MRVIVVGSGVGGLCAAIRLAAAGHEVSVYERNPVAGGKLATHREQGFSFDIGPTLLTLPHLLDEVVRLGGTSLADEVELVRLDPQCRYRWVDGSVLALPDDSSTTAAAVEEFSPGAGDQWSAFQRHAEQIWEISERTFLAGPISSPLSLLGRMRSPLDLARVDGTRTLSKMTASTFDDPRLQQLVNRYATYSGSSPYRAPATLSCISHVEQAYGCWHVVGGLGRLADALVSVAERMGVRFELGAEVGRIAAHGRAVSGVELADGGTAVADVVIADVDAAHLYTDLLPHPRRAKQLDRVPRSASAFLMCVAARGRTEGIVHHNVFFPLHDEQEFRLLSAGQLAIDPTLYACVSAVTDPSMAPTGSENWVVLVTSPPATGIDKRLMAAGVLNRLAERGVDLRDRVEFTRTFVPADFDARYRSPGGAIYGSSSDGKQAAFARPDNVGPVDGLYLVGGSTHPGGGIPMVAVSARIVADLVADRHG